MKKSLLALVAGFLLLTTSFAFGDNLKIGVVDMNQILQKSPLMVSLNDNLAKKFKPRQDEINTANKQLQDEVNQLNLNGSTMSSDDKSKLQNKILNDKANVQILSASYEKDLAIAKDQALQTFMAKFSSVIGKIAKDGQYDLIEQRSNMVYVNDKVDLTQQVLQQLSA